MTRPSAQTVRRTAGDLSDQMSPHVSHARQVMVDTVLPKAKETMVETVLPRARDAKDVVVDTMVDTVIPKAKDTMVGTVIPKARETMDKTMDAVVPMAKATGAGLAIRAGLVEPPKKRHPWRKAALVGAAAVGVYAAWNAWRLPEAPDDWTQADAEARTAPASADGQGPTVVPGVPADTSRIA